MANYYATARSNYVKVADMEGLQKALNGCDVNIVEGSPNDPTTAGKHALLSNSEDGWSSFLPTKTDDPYEETENFDFHIHVMPFIEEGEVMVIMEVGNEKMRYSVGEAAAFVRIGKEVKEVCVSLDSIYDLAASEFAIERNQITPAEY